MICELCGERDSVVHVQQVIGNQKVDIHLCEVCATEKGISRKDDKIELSLSQLLTGLLPEVERSEDPPVEVCPSCGVRIEEFKKTGSLGCPTCYSSFAADIRELHRKLSGKASHSGKLPEKLLTYRSLLIDREKLKTKLDEAIRKEDYESAAAIRDRISAIERNSESTDG